MARKPMHVLIVEDEPFGSGRAELPDPARHLRVARPGPGAFGRAVEIEDVVVRQLLAVQHLR